MSTSRPGSAVAATTVSAPRSLAAVVDDASIKVATPHLADQRRYHAVLQGRPLWYLCLMHASVQEYLKVRWLDYLFPVAVDTHRKELVLNADVQPEPHPSAPRFRAMGVAMPCAAPKAPTGDAIPDFARAPFDVSTAREEALHGGMTSMYSAVSRSQHNGSNAHTIPTAVDTMSGSRQVLLKRIQQVFAAASPLQRRAASAASSSATKQTASKNDKEPVSSSKPKQSTYAVAATGVTAPLSEAFHPSVTKSKGGGANTTLSPTGICGTAVTGASPGQGRPRSASLQRVSTTALLREEIERNRCVQQKLQKQQTLSPSSKAGEAEGTDDDVIAEDAASPLWNTPTESKYAMWVSTSRGRSWCDRFLELSQSVADMLRNSSQCSEFQALLGKCEALAHPVKVHIKAIEEQLISGVNQPQPEKRDGGSSLLLPNNDNSAMVRLHDPSERALLELRVFGYLPSTPLSMAASGGSEPPPQLLTDIEALVRNRVEALKRHPGDCLGASVELYRRNTRVRSALDLWWSSMPKQKDASHGRAASYPVSEPSTDDNSATTRYFFVQMSTFIHCALLAGEDLPFATRPMFETVRRLMTDDWVALFLTPPAVPLSTAAAHHMTTSAVYRSTLARGAQKPLRVDRDLFDTALLLLLEPWMETRWPDERELALVLLFPRVFVSTGNGDAADDGGVGNRQFRYSLRPLPESVAPLEDSSRRPQSAGSVHARCTRGTLDSGVACAIPLPLNVDQCASKMRRSRSPVPQSRPQSPVSGDPRAASGGGAALRCVSALADDLAIAGVDASLAEQLVDRYRREAHGDAALEYDNPAWRASVLRQQLALQLPIAVLPSASGRPLEERVEHATHVGKASESAGIRHLNQLKRSFTPHDPSRSFGVERVMLQRLTKKLSKDSSNDTSLVSIAEQASIVSHCTKKLIPATYLHRIAKYHRVVVDQFRQTVQNAASAVVSSCTPEGRLSDDHLPSHSLYAELTSPYIRQDERMSLAADAVIPSNPSPQQQLLGSNTDAVLSLLQEETQGTRIPTPAAVSGNSTPAPPLLADVEALAALLVPPDGARREHLPEATQRRAEKRLEQVSNYFVRRPHSAGLTGSADGNRDHVSSSDAKRSATMDDAQDHHVSESLRRPISALRARRMEQQSREQPGTAAAAAAAVQRNPSRRSRPSSAAPSSHDVIYVSPFMNRGCLPVSNGAFTGHHRRPGSAH